MSQEAALALSLFYRFVTDNDRGLQKELIESNAASGSAFAIIEGQHIQNVHLSSETAEKAGLGQYPAVHIYCEKVHNSLGEKFRSFSGTVEIAVDVRMTDEHPDSLAAAVHMYTSAMASVLHRLRGRWADGVFYSGAYDIGFAPARRGGRNFIQTATVRFEVNVSS